MGGVTILGKAEKECQSLSVKPASGYSVSQVSAEKLRLQQTPVS